jgi:hypothetical protein
MGPSKVVMVENVMIEDKKAIECMKHVKFNGVQSPVYDEKEQTFKINGNKEVLSGISYGNQTKIIKLQWVHHSFKEFNKVIAVLINNEDQHFINIYSIKETPRLLYRVKFDCKTITDFDIIQR